MGSEPGANANCPGCGASFRCGMRDGGTRCWCADLPKVVPVPADGGGGCLCPNCLDALVRKRHAEVELKASAASADYGAAGGRDGK